MPEDADNGARDADYNRVENRTSDRAERRGRRRPVRRKLGEERRWLEERELEGSDQGLAEPEPVPLLPGDAERNTWRNAGRLGFAAGTPPAPETLHGARLVHKATSPLPARRRVIR